jgi:hypothetical protein
MMRRCAPRFLRCLQNKQLTACLEFSGASTESVAPLCTQLEAVRTANVPAQPWCMWPLQGKQGQMHTPLGCLCCSSLSMFSAAELDVDKA